MYKQIWEQNKHEHAFFTNRKLPSIHSESVPRSRSIASTYSYAVKRGASKSLVLSLLKRKAEIDFPLPSKLYERLMVNERAFY